MGREGCEIERVLKAENCRIRVLDGEHGKVRHDDYDMPASWDRWEESRVYI